MCNFDQDIIDSPLVFDGCESEIGDDSASIDTEFISDFSQPHDTRRLIFCQLI